MVEIKNIKFEFERMGVRPRGPTPERVSLSVSLAGTNAANFVFCNANIIQVIILGDPSLGR